MEKNLWNALHCIATKTELAVLAIYAQAVTHSYMRQIRTPGKNMLELGPLHKKVQNHVRRIIEDPIFLLGPNASFKMGAMDGLEWESPKVFAAIQKLLPEFPHIKPVMTAFFEGAYNSWKCFTSEFAPGGLIDEATAAAEAVPYRPRDSAAG